MTGSDTPRPDSDPPDTEDEAVEADPQPQPASTTPEEDDPAIKETEEQPS